MRKGSDETLPIVAGTIIIADIPIENPECPAHSVCLNEPANLFSDFQIAIGKRHPHDPFRKESASTFNFPNLLGNEIRIIRLAIAKWWI